ncbi:MAG TPA: transglutaminase-like domain-containing protein, partial [Chthoniobacterales bacterium]
ILSGCNPKPAPLPKELRKEIARLEREHHSAEEAVKNLPGAAASLTPPPLPEWDQSISPDELRPRIQAALRALLEFRFTLIESRAVAPAQSVSFIAAESGDVFQFTGPPKARTQSLRIENTGSALLVNPRLQANENSDWFDVSSLLDAVLRPGMSDREKVVALWKFVVASRQHGYRAHPAAELHDPVRFLNVYGYGFCDDASSALTVLASEAGIPTRIWDLSGHVVPEFFFDGKWNLLDPDGEVCYFEKDGVTFADVESLQREPERIREFPSPFYQDAEKLIQIYGTKDDNRLSDFYERTRGQPQRMAYTLRPGEGLWLSRLPAGRYFSADYFQEPPDYGSGRLTFEPVFREGLFQLGAQSVKNLTPVSGGLETTGGESELVYLFSLPYPMLDGRVELECELPEGGSVKVEFSEDGKKWTQAGQSTAPGQQSVSVKLTAFFRNGFGDPVYQYWLRLRFDSPAGKPARISRLHYQMDVQAAPKSLPQLAGGENTLRFLQSGDGAARVTVDYTE